MTSCDTGTPLRDGTGATERRILQAAGAKAHALIENEHVTGIVSFQQSGDKLAVSAQLQYTDGTAETTTQHSYRLRYVRSRSGSKI